MCEPWPNVSSPRRFASKASSEKSGARTSFDGPPSAPTPMTPESMIATSTPAPVRAEPCAPMSARMASMEARARAAPSSGCSSTGAVGSRTASAPAATGSASSPAATGSGASDPTVVSSVASASTSRAMSSAGASVGISAGGGSMGAAALSPATGSDVGSGSGELSGSGVSVRRDGFGPGSGEPSGSGVDSGAGSTVAVSSERWSGDIAGDAADRVRAAEPGDRGARHAGREAVDDVEPLADFAAAPGHRVAGGGALAGLGADDDGHLGCACVRGLGAEQPQHEEQGEEWTHDRAGHVRHIGTAPRTFSPLGEKFPNGRSERQFPRPAAMLGGPTSVQTRLDGRRVPVALRAGAQRIRRRDRRRSPSPLSPAAWRAGARAPCRGPLASGPARSARPARP